jgi:hypothetical protein
MEEAKQRAANIFRFLSMMVVIGALLFMYAYGTDEHSIRPQEYGLIEGFSKTALFYYGLVIFGVLNILANWGIKVYRDVIGYDMNSRFFKNEMHKARILFWLTLTLTAINLLIASVVAYIAFIRIDGASAQTDYLHLPIIGLALLVIVLIGLLISVFRDK